MPEKVKHAREIPFVMAMDVPCCRCGANPGHPCREETGLIRKFSRDTHSVRILDAYNETIKRQKESRKCHNQKPVSGGTETSKATT